MAYNHSTFTTSRALTYSYVHIASKVPNNQYILFLHGFPSTSRDWRCQISLFASQGYGIIAPDLLGFGETSKPTELKMYKTKDMANDIVEILAAENVGVVVGVAHDWGTFLLSRLANYHPELFSAYAFIDHGYSSPSQSLSTATIQHIDKSVQVKLGYSIFGYFLFFDDEDAPRLLDEHSNSVQSLFFASDEETGKKYKGAWGGLRTWLTEGRTHDLPTYLNSEDREHYQYSFSAKNGGYAPAVNWYRAILRSINAEDEQTIPASAMLLSHPTLLIVSSNFITNTMDFPERMCPVVADLAVEKVDGGHWLHLEKADEVNAMLASFIEEKSRI